MTAAITAAGVAVVGSAIINNQQAKAAEGAANAQKKAIGAATDVERERLALESQQYQEQMQEYQRRQAMLEKQQAQTQVMLAPYMQAGQGALYEMMALSGMAAPAGAQMPDYTAPTTSPGGLRVTPGVQPAPGGPTRGILSGGAAGLRGGLLPQLLASATKSQSPAAAEFQKGGLLPQLLASATKSQSPAAAEFQKGGLSLSSKRWQLAQGTSPRKEAADMLAQVRAEMPTATADQQQQEAINRLNAGYAGMQQAQGLAEARAQVPDIATAANPYAGMTGEQAQATAIERIAQSPLLQELMAQGETGMLQNAAATGGLRGGRTQAALAQLRPAMLQNEIDKMYSRYQGLSGMGQQSILRSPTTPGTNIPAMSYQSKIPELLTQGGATQAGSLLAQGNANADLMRTVVGGIGYGLGQYANNWTPQYYNSETPQYAGLGIGNPGNY